MKKRMLVTTIALVLVIAVALTTSSLAWFSTSSTVTTSQLTFSAHNATGSNLVLGNLDNLNVSQYGTTVTLPNGLELYPAQGLPAIAGKHSELNVNTNKITLAPNPFLKAENVRQTTGFAVADQKVDLKADGNYLAGGFNYANATGDPLESGVKVKATITLAPVTTGAVDADGKVNKGYIAYDSGWKSAGSPVTASAVFFKAQDVALLASIRIAIFGAANVTSDTTFGDATAIYDFNGTGVVLTQNGYATGDAGSNDKYATAVANDVSGTVVTDPENGTSYGEIKHIDTTETAGTFTFTETFSTAIEAGKAGSIAYVIWMDGWDESALPGVSDGRFSMTFEVSASSDVA